MDNENIIDIKRNVIEYCWALCLKPEESINKQMFIYHSDNIVWCKRERLTITSTEKSEGCFIGNSFDPNCTVYYSFHEEIIPVLREDIPHITVNPIKI